MTLIGPKPDVDVPDLPTPWEAVGDAIADVNGRCVLIVNSAITHLDRHEVAVAVADSINRDHGRQDDELTVKLANAHLDNRDLRQKLTIADQERDEARAEVERVRDELAHMSAPRRYEGIDAPAPGVDDRDEATTEPTYYLAADVENRFREYVRGAVVGGMDERIGLAWRQFEGVLTAFPAPSVPDGDPLAHVRPGNPDPTAKRVGVDCDAEYDGLLCTREQGHPGQHIAGGEDEVVSVWRADA